MSINTGQINVQTENIFPIIKKFLYSDHEIFLRELVSNAVDASQKIKTLAGAGEFKGELGELQVKVNIDKEQKTITISDHGLGMTAEEVDRYINQIAFSGAEEFVEKYKDKADATSIIGHFGLGFYSAFMVASKVELLTRSYKGEEAVRWSCDGSPNFTLSPDNRAERGTDVILHIAEDSEEFLDNFRIEGLLKKYCKFLPIPIFFEEKQINNTQPAWTRKPADLKAEDYQSFYKELYPFAEEPLFHIHLNVDYPFNLTGILFFPKIKRNFEVQKDKIQLFCNQVFVTDSVEGIVPDFLMMLHGVLDSPDIPLNVSRSYLQSDANVKKISSHITKKVADKLEEIFKNDRKDFEQKWDDIRLFIQYGMLSEEKFAERGQKFHLIKNTEGQYFTKEEYHEKTKALQTDKQGQWICLYTSDAQAQHSFVEGAKQKGYDVAVFDSPIDAHLLNFLEQKWEKTRFVRVDAEVADKLIEKDEPMPSKWSEEEQKQIKEAVEKTISRPEFTVQLENLSSDELPMLILRPEFMRRMKEMSALGGQSWMGSMPESYQLVVNANHPLYDKVMKAETEEGKQALLSQAFDLAQLSQGLLKGEALTGFIKRSLQLID